MLYFYIDLLILCIFDIIEARNGLGGGGPYSSSSSNLPPTRVGCSKTHPTWP